MILNKRYEIGTVFHHITAKNADGSPVRARVNGKTKQWKTRNDFRIPMKYGLRDHFYITNDNADQWVETE